MVQSDQITIANLCPKNRVQHIYFNLNVVIHQWQHYLALGAMMITEISEVSAILGSIKTALDVAKMIKDGGLTLKTAEINLKIADLIEALAEVKVQVASVQLQLMDKNQIIVDLNNKLEPKLSDSRFKSVTL